MTTERPKTLLEMVKDPWFKSRPQAIKEMIMHYPPGLYLMKSTGQKVLLVSYEEALDKTCSSCSVDVLRYHNPEVIMERRVFGVPLSDLEPIEVLG